VGATDLASITIADERAFHIPQRRQERRIFRDRGDQAL
jgi:hypothetical protein